MNDIRDLLKQLSAMEREWRSTEFIAPCVAGGKIRVKISGLVSTLKIEPRDFQGWGIFQAVDDSNAVLITAADPLEIEQYLEQFIAIRFHLAYPLTGQTWLAYPVNEGDAKKRLGKVQPTPIYLVTEGRAFEQIVTRFDGNCCWFAEIDRRSNPETAEQLQLALQQRLEPEELKLKGITPELRTVYSLAWQQIPEVASEQKRLEKALKKGGGELKQYQDRGDYWTVEWKTGDGEEHWSAIAKSDLTVISAGICLSGRDRDFDLQSLVGVIEQSP